MVWYGPLVKFGLAVPAVFLFKFLCTHSLLTDFWIYWFVF